MMRLTRILLVLTTGTLLGTGAGGCNTGGATGGGLDIIPNYGIGLGSLTGLL